MYLRWVVGWPEDDSDGLPEVGQLLLALGDVLGLWAETAHHDLVLLGEAVLGHQVGSQSGDQCLPEGCENSIKRLILYDPRKYEILSLTVQSVQVSAVATATRTERARMVFMVIWWTASLDRCKVIVLIIFYTRTLISGSNCTQECWMCTLGSHNWLNFIPKWKFEKNVWNWQHLRNLRTSQLDLSPTLASESATLALSQTHSASHIKFDWLRVHDHTHLSAIC